MLVNNLSYLVLKIHEQFHYLKHSNLIRNDIMTIEKIKKEHSYIKQTNFEEFTEICKTECKFLFDKYTDIFHKLLKDELNLFIMSNLLEILSKIEEGEIDQQEGSFMVGTILKKLYVDSALKTGANLDRKREETGEMVKEPVYAEPKDITWKKYKKMV